MTALHPAAVLALWASAAVFVQTLDAPALWWAAAGVAVLALWIARDRFLRLTRRLRILLLVTLVLFGFATPGVRVFPAWIGVSLTWDGLWLGLAHGVRLIVMVALVAWLLERLSRERLVCGLQALFAALAPLGVPAHRIAVRLMLVLRSIEQPTTGWRAWLLEAEAPGEATQIEVHAQALRRVDHGVFAAVAVFWLVWTLR